MGEKKLGRPTDNPKTMSVKFLADEETYAMLKVCSDELEISRAEVIRKGIHQGVRRPQEKLKGKRRIPSTATPLPLYHNRPKDNHSVNMIPYIAVLFKARCDYPERRTAL